MKKKRNKTALNIHNNLFNYDFWIHRLFDWLHCGNKFNIPLNMVKKLQHKCNCDAI
jgi:hypothetical protein